MTHLWVRAEQRDHEERVGLTPEGAAALIGAGLNANALKQRSVCSAASRRTSPAPHGGGVGRGAELIPSHSKRQSKRSPQPHGYASLL